MANYKIILVLLAFGLLNTSLAQPTVNAENKPVEKNMYITDKDYWKGYVSDTKSIITSPSRWQGLDWLTVTLVTGTTFCLYILDEDIRDFVQDNQSDTGDDMANSMKVFGDGRYTLPPLGLLYVYGHYKKNKRALRTTLLGLESFIISGTFTQVIKFTGHRHRPGSEDSSHRWDGPGLSFSNLSFPSGHSQTTFSIATVIAFEYNEYGFIPPLAYGIATLSALSRVYDNDHWTSDVFFGSALGYFTAKEIIRLHDSKRGKNLILLPIIDNSKTGLLITYKF
jgi:membrane-associated phospholipid phosphatase